MKRIAIILLTLTSILFVQHVPEGLAKASNELSLEEKYEQRLTLYEKMEAITNVPWYYLAAVDTYERGLRRAQKDRPAEEGLIAIYFSPQQWVGPLNPDLEDTNPLSISMFNGVGLDGNGDGVADRNNDEDVLYTFARYLESYGFKEEDFRIALWEYYQREQSVNIIYGHANVYKTFKTLDLDDHTFPLPLHHNYSYRSTWGDRRGWGGRRIHEGTDIFANYNVPVMATAYGIVEIKGWNKYGGWRIGVRDLDNVYHYYAHLSGFEKGVEKGTVVAPGDVIGYVGSSGYGKPGTQGKFPPHLHYGMYRDNGYTEWSFDPYPSLKSWERKAYQERKKKK
ncbi:BH3436 [Halalkalibacterium halodurans C-125]|uniref:BH3436 protein n=1 Tax=Halalkalibacterium halodurans (strain ATCC BAA-125 / DSM 18197 / FERM 7344 / JCM 9153 / C-125) TaxID=272558 RepID=Q9K7C8_HALH5|nr:M23 family metallopeptidase [Halalkalibacterium halodurans]BAB07155.1 BH3436 [Halalkalibacterium halodurans C-125]